MSVKFDLDMNQCREANSKAERKHHDVGDRTGRFFDLSISPALDPKKSIRGLKKTQLYKQLRSRPCSVELCFCGRAVKVYLPATSI